MYRLITVIILLLLAAGSFAEQSQMILQSLQQDANWELIKEKDNTVFLRKPLPDFDLYALEIQRETAVSPEAVFAVLLDVPSYREILGDNKYLQAELVDVLPDQIIGYQYARIPLIPNRHYLFTFDLKAHKRSLQTDNQQLIWTLLAENGEYSDFINSQNELYNNPVYIKNGAGIWTVTPQPNGRYLHSYRLYLDPAGWMPAWLLNSFNVKNLQDLFNKVLDAAENRR